MESVKGFIFGRGEFEKRHVYLVSFILVTEQPLDNVSPTGETVIMGTCPGDMLTTGLEFLNKYKPPYPLGDANNAILLVSDLNPNELEKIK